MLGEEEQDPEVEPGDVAAKVTLIGLGEQMGEIAGETDKGETEWVSLLAEGNSFKITGGGSKEVSPEEVYQNRTQKLLTGHHLSALFLNLSIG